jgi:integrase
VAFDPDRVGRRVTRTSGDPTKKHASKSVANRLAAWVREQPGFQDPRKDPNHAFRHWFKTELGALQVADSLADAIMGHAGRTEADTYRHPSIERKAEAISKVKAPPATGVPVVNSIVLAVD